MRLTAPMPALPLDEASLGTKSGRTFWRRQPIGTRNVAGVIVLGDEAERQVDVLVQHCLRREPPEAVHSLVNAIDQAVWKIERDPGAGLPAPRPYPTLARSDRAWIKAGP